MLGNEQKGKQKRCLARTYQSSIMDFEDEMLEDADEYMRDVNETAKALS